nr:recombinase family protein [Bacillus cereus]
MHFVILNLGIDTRTPTGKLFRNKINSRNEK